MLNTTHSDPNLEVTFMTGLNESLTNESFGMRELYIIIDFVSQPNNKNTPELQGMIDIKHTKYIIANSSSFISIVNSG